MASNRTPSQGAATNIGVDPAIHALFDALQRAWHDADMERWSALYTEDADFISWEGIWWQSRADNLSAHQAMPPEVQRQLPNYSLTVESLEMLSDSIGLVHARWRWPEFVDSPGLRENRSGLLTMVLLKIDAQWRIRAAHNTRIE